MEQGEIVFMPPVDPSMSSPTGPPQPPVQGKATGAALQCSRDGAAAVEGVITARQRELVIAALRQGPLNDGELHAITGISRSSLCGRRRELRLLGLIEKDEHRTRPNPQSGVHNALWRLKAWSRRRRPSRPLSRTGWESHA